VLGVSGVAGGGCAVSPEHKVMCVKTICFKLAYDFIYCLVPLRVVHEQSGEEDVLCFCRVMGMNSLYYLLVALFPLCACGIVVDVDIIDIGQTVVLVVLTKGKYYCVGGVA